MLNYLSYIKSSGFEGAVTVGLYVMNQVILNEKETFVGGESYTDTVWVVYFVPDLYYEYVKPATIDLKKKVKTG